MKKKLKLWKIVSTKKYSTGSKVGVEANLVALLNVKYAA